MNHILNACTDLLYEVRKRTPLIHNITNYVTANDCANAVLAVDATGVHIGQRDIPTKIARKLIGNNKILGVSASNYEEAIMAYRDNADYLGVGAMFRTDTKTDARITSIDELIQIKKNIPLPIVVIGGINETTIPKFEGIDINGLAVVSAIISQPDIKVATQNLKSIFNYCNSK